MENKNVGYILLGISILIIIIIFLFDSALKEIVSSSCSMEKEICPMNKSINKQTYLSLGIVGLLILVGLTLIFSKPQEKIIIKTNDPKKPNSSAMAAKIESVEASGKNKYFCREAPNPRPKNPPEDREINI